MSSSPAGLSDPERSARYGLSWSALMQLARIGHSFSGRERNVCYLNEGSGRFADVSSPSGLDVPDDGRALGVVDWDGDGDLDLWYRNRTAPRLRLMLNRHARRDGGFVALRLRGTKSNRDGIGAVVEIVTGDGEATAPGDRLVRSLRAGDLFLSQSSKWLHFGLADAHTIEEVRVLWPGGARETFRGTRPNGRFLLEEGSGVAAPWEPRVERRPSRLTTTGEPLEAPADTREGRVVLPRRIPFPRIAYREGGAGEPAGEPSDESAGESRAQLFLVFSSACPHCREELAALAKDAAALRTAGLGVLAVSVDGLESDAAARVVAETRFPFPWGRLDAVSIERLRTFQEALFDRTPPASVPLAFLLDGEQNAVAIYRGAVSTATLRADAARLVRATDAELHHLAPPFDGTWFTSAVDDSALAEFLARQFQERLPEEALAYLALACETASGARQAILARELAARHHAFARAYREREEPERAAYHFEAALARAPESAEIHYDYAVLLATFGRLDDAEREFQRVLELDPNSEAARESLRLVRELRREGGE